MWTRALGAGLLLLLLSGCAPAGAGNERTTATAAVVTLSIVGTNDLHGGLLPVDGRGGLALLGGYVANLRAARARDGGAVLLLDAGDMFQGTLESNITEGASVIAAYNALGYAAAAVGNHEFDFGPVGPAATPGGPGDDPRGALKARAAEAKFPFLAANLIDTTTGRTPAWTNVQPTALVQAAGVKIGIIGVMTRGALTATLPMNVRDLSVAPLTATILAHAKTLRAEGAAAVIVTAHAGGRCGRFDSAEDLSSCEPSSEIFSVARELPRGLVDVMVAGHTHAGIGHQVEGVAITEAFHRGRAFGRVDLWIDRARNTVTAKRSFPPRDLCAREDPETHRCDPAGTAGRTLVQAEYENAPVVPDPAIADVLAPALEEVRVIKATPLGVTLETPIRRLTPVSPLGHLVTDALLASVPGADVALNNSSGGLRADLPRGPLTYGSVYEVMPFDNVVVQIRLTGRELRRVFAAHFAASRRVLGFSGLQVRARCSGGSVDVTMLRPSGARIGDTEELRVVISDFLATGGDGLLRPVIPPGGFPVEEGARLVRDVLVEYVRRLPGPLREEQLLERKDPRLSVQGSLPLECGTSGNQARDSARRTTAGSA
jgi:5'-nucleotidase